MNIAPGIRLGSYEIIALLGKGGMGEVYRAKDLRLDREVAIKVLPADLANDAERLRRFELEARATSALNHPNILTVHDFGLHDNAPYIVAELLDGEELRAQLNNGALPVRRSVEYAQQIAAGLAAAHEKGIVHRDLKPENLFVTKDNRVKILDFGLAKLRPPRNVSAGSDVATAKQYTNPGTVMGTVAYMSPEQVRGQDLEQRSDIFSFGLILYEMLAGERAFQKQSLAETMAAIANEEPPDLSELNPKVTPQLEKIVRHCLEKKPEMRFQSARDLGFALEALTPPGSSGANRTEAVQALEPSTATKGSGWRDRLGWIAAGLMTLIALALGVAYIRRPALEAETVRLSVTPPETATSFDYPTISPDGRTLAFVATVAGKTQLWVRPLNSTTAKPLAEVGRVSAPFWSPDSRYLAYADSEKLKKIALDGGAPETLCDTQFNFAGTWNREGVILFGGATAGIRRISASGGAVTEVTTVDRSRGEARHLAPVFLPDDRHFLFANINNDRAKSAVYLASLDGGEAKLLQPLENLSFAVTMNPAAENEGYLLFVRQGVLLAQQYDFRRNQLAGEPLRLAEQVQTPDNFRRFSVSTNGVLVLIEGNANQQLAWFDRAGNKQGTVGPAGIYVDPRLSADNQRLAVGWREAQARGLDIRLFDLARGTDARFTFDSASDNWPLWSPDASRIVWTSSREGPGD
ncbi:MAG: serine/threonine-protein kinase, partial [Blastocatellia bacterium]|nr:serine/threonine-protein kinase [Blastocatellia bacterium]